MDTLIWTPINNGDTLSAVRTLINNSGSNTTAQVNTNTNTIAANGLLITANTANILSNSNAIINLVEDIVDIEEAQANIVTSLSTFAVLNGQAAPAYSLTTIAQPLLGYSEPYAGSFMAVNSVSGTITPTNSGYYQVTYTGDISFVSSTSTRSITLGLYNGTTIIASSVINMPRDSTRDTGSLVMIVPLIGGTPYSIQALSSTNMGITFNILNYSIKLVG